LQKWQFTKTTISQKAFFIFGPILQKYGSLKIIIKKICGVLFTGFQNDCDFQKG
jgi:hypothetical protein